MSDAVSKDKKFERFIQNEPLDFGEIQAYIGVASGIISIVDKLEGRHSVCLYVTEARELRDWLNKVLP